MTKHNQYYSLVISIIHKTTSPLPIFAYLCLDQIVAMENQKLDLIHQVYHTINHENSLSQYKFDQSRPQAHCQQKKIK